MTTHRCCPGCGAELPAHGGTSCGCVGPFTADHVDPMHIRPYVDLPEPEARGTHSPDLEPFARCGTEETAELHAVLPPEQPPGQGDGDARQLSAPPSGRGRRSKKSIKGARGASGAPGARLVSEAPGAPDRLDPREKAAAGGRRRGSTAALAAAGVAAALGAGLLTTQSLTGDKGSGDDRSLSSDDRTFTDVPSGGPTEEPSRTEAGERGGKPAPAPSRTATGAARADRDGDEHTSRDAVPSAGSSSAPSRSGDSGESGRGGESGREGGGDRDRDRPRPPQRPEQPGGPTLRAGDTGTEVVELQRRLKQAGALPQEAPEDGVYSRDVQQGVARYQAARQVRGDDFGEYGPNTRRALESHTAG